MTWTLGLDPGNDGAGVLLAPDGYAEVLWSWRQAQDRALLTLILQAGDGGEVFLRTARPRTMAELGALLAAGVGRVIGSDPIQIRYETSFLGKNPSSGLRLAMGTGRLLASLELQQGVEAVGVLATAWRAQVLSLPARTKSEVVKQASLDRMPGLVPGLPELLKCLQQRRQNVAHETDAAGVGSWKPESSASKSSPRRPSRRSRAGSG